MKSSRSVRPCVQVVLAAIAAGLGGCSNSAPQGFAQPEQALEALVGALRSDNQTELHKILGSDADKLLSSGDEVADANGRAEFLKLYDEKHTLKEDGADARILEVGATEWPMPVPIIKGEQGWYFDTAEGLDEMLSRRIGRNELDAIQVCRAIADAQREFVIADADGDGWREYAQKFRSDPGKRNGLYWAAAPGEPESPLGELIATATSESYNLAKDTGGPQPYHGYFYRILTAQGTAAPGGEMSYIVKDHMMGGFGVIAWPAEYANSGLKSFLVSHHGVVYEKDLGDSTDSIARGMKAFDPGAGWTRCQEESAK